MTTLGQAIRRGDTASKPDAATVDIGTIYYDTDLGKWQRSNGTSWEDCDPAGTGGDVTWAIIQASQLANEVMGFPSLVSIDIDLDAAGQWWDKVGTPSTAVTQVDLAGEAGITETWEYALKTVADGANEGFSQRYTYADQPRIKNGRALSAIAAIWVGTAGRTVTMKIITSAATEVTATATAQGWTICRCENLTLDGTYVDLQFIVDGADTFYVVPLGVNIGAKAVPLSNRGLRFRWADNSPNAKDLNGIGDENTWKDVDCTAITSNLAAILNAVARVSAPGSGNAFDLKVRRNSEPVGGEFVLSTNASTEPTATNDFQVILDDAQIFEYLLDRTAGSDTMSSGRINIRGWWEWE